MSNRIFVAIDTPDLARAQAMANKVRHHVGGLKLGLEFFCAHGAGACARWRISGCPSSST
jgi:orotidine-5'-phosphate decarboxylase